MQIKVDSQNQYNLCELLLTTLSLENKILTLTTFPIIPLKI